MIMGSIDRQDIHTNSGESLRVSGGLSYTRMRELLQEKL